LGNVAVLSAQVVRGVVLEAGSTAPVRGAFVVLVDSAGRARAGVLTDDHGVYAIPAQGAGTYRVRAERIGHASTTSDAFTLTTGQTHTVDIQAAVAPIELAAVTTSKTSACVRRPTTGERTAQLWEEARKALSVTQWTSNQPYRFAIKSWTRDLEVPSLKVIGEKQRAQITRTKPYAAVALDTLLRYGFVRKDEADMVFYGVDADVLVSDAFLDGHCFHSVMGEGKNRGSIGLAFSPVPNTKLPDVKGTLWLDPKTFELEYLEFTYENLPREYRLRGIGGRTEFRRLDNGAWIVDKWYIRMPVLVGRGGNRGYGIQEEGGQITKVFGPDK
jgi:hypothetical protein